MFSKAVVYIVGMFFLLNVSCSKNFKQNQKPNILLILSDDQGYADFSAYGGADDVKTPNLDRIANAGVRFTNAYSSSPICNPARSAIITGRYTQRWGNYYYGGNPLPTNSPTLAELLKKEGYRCVKIGKTHFSAVLDNNKNIKDPRIHRDFPLNHGFEEFFGFAAPRHDYFRLKQSDRDMVRPEDAIMSQHGPLWRNNTQVDCEGYTTNIFGEEAVKQINKDDKRPFFIQVSFNAVHHPIFQAPEKYLKKFGIKAFPQWDPKGEAFDDWHVRWCWRSKEDPDGRKRYLASLACMDDNIGKILDALEKNGKCKNTLVIFVSDNGGSQNTYANNGALSGHKYILKEGGIRTPFVMRWPGNIPPHLVVNKMVWHYDIYPTVLSAINSQADDSLKLDGNSLLQNLRENKDGIVHDHLVWDIGNEWVVRKGNWKLHQVKKNNHFRTIHLDAGTFLYNLKDDIGEKKNLAEKYPGKVRELTQIYDSWKKEMQ